MEPGNEKAPRRPGPRWGTLALVVAGHLIVGAALIRAFAPQFPAQAIEAVGSLVTVTITAPPEPTPSPSTQPDSGTAGKEGREATPREPRIAVRPTPVPRASPTGATASGAHDKGSGSGAGGDGSGTGGGASGGGQGSGAPAKPVLVSGAIDDARAYPIPEGGREARIGKTVIIALTVGIDGHPDACRIYRSSGLPETDAVTCRLALERLRFRAARNARGEPVVGTFYWQQRFFF